VDDKLISGLFGLGGVIVGAAITVAKDFWQQHRKDKKDAAFLVIQVSTALEKFSAHCASVAADDGTSEGPPGDGEYHSIQVEDPKLDFDSLKVEWKSLPSNLMGEVLSLPYRLEIILHEISNAFEFADPPDYIEGFHKRRLRFSELGIEAHQLAQRLRNHVGLPPLKGPEWDHIQYMKEQIQQIKDREKKLREKLWKNWGQTP
jgi:hypothetical protein